MDKPASLLRRRARKKQFRARLRLRTGQLNVFHIITIHSTSSRYTRPAPETLQRGRRLLAIGAPERFEATVREIPCTIADAIEARVRAAKKRICREALLGERLIFVISARESRRCKVLQKLRLSRISRRVKVGDRPAEIDGATVLPSKLPQYTPPAKNNCKGFCVPKRAKGQQKRRVHVGNFL
jgi:hypothetical protein